VRRFSAQRGAAVQRFAVSDVAQGAPWQEAAQDGPWRRADEPLPEAARDEP
jgi:hypothetical protein